MFTYITYGTICRYYLWHCSYLSFYVRLVQSYKLFCVDVFLLILPLEKDFVLMLPRRPCLWRGKYNSRGCIVFWYFVWVSLYTWFWICSWVAGCKLIVRKSFFFFLRKINQRGVLGSMKFDAIIKGSVMESYSIYIIFVFLNR